MKKRPLAWAATGLALARLTRRFSSPVLPDPGPLPASVPIPQAEPPDDMELVAVPTGVNNRVAAYAGTAPGPSRSRRSTRVAGAAVSCDQPRPAPVIGGLAGQSPNPACHRRRTTRLREAGRPRL